MNVVVFRALLGAGLVMASFRLHAEFSSMYRPASRQHHSHTKIPPPILCGLPLAGTTAMAPVKGTSQHAQLALGISSVLHS